MTRLFYALLALCLLSPTADAAKAKKKKAPVKAAEMITSHGMAMHGDLKYPADFKHFDYVNPGAPKGGRLRLAASGTYDTFNPFVIKGLPAAGIMLAYDTLLTSSQDEAFSEYGLLAEKVEYPKDRSSITFTLRKEAKFHDGTPVTAEDVAFSFNILREKGLPSFRFYYGDVKETKVLSPDRIRFVFKSNENRELPLILGQMPVLPKHVWKDKDFNATTLELPVGSGPYKVRSFEAGRSVVYERDKDYWAKDLPAVRGYYNFDVISYDYYRDTTVMVEALKAGNIDLRPENEAKKWATAYDDSPSEKGLWNRIKGWFGKKGPQKGDVLVKKLFPHKNPSGIQGFVYNLRRPLFQDATVRKALAYAFDFEWVNRNFFYGEYRRTRSYFDNSELAAAGLPSKAEEKILAPYKKLLPPEVWTTEYRPPETDGTGNLRDNLTEAFALLKEAGWEIKDGVLRNKKGEPFEFQILLDAPNSAAWERISLPFVQNLKKLGITAKLQVVDINQYKNRLDGFDFDMIVNIWGQSLSPGNEQRYFWGSAAADSQGSQNYAGIKNSAVDALIEQVITAKDRQDLIEKTHALDRALQFGYYLIPHWHLPVIRMVYWDRLGYPDVLPEKGPDIMTWWEKPKE